MTIDELMAYRRAEAVKAAAVDIDHEPATLPASEHPETENTRRIREMHAANRAGQIPLAPGALENLHVGSTVTANERSIGSLDDLNNYFKNKLGYDAHGFKPWGAIR